MKHLIAFVCFFALLAIQAFAQPKHIFLNKESYEVSRNIRNLIEEKGYDVKSDIFINNYVIVANKQGKSFSDLDGNILSGNYNFLTNVSKDGIFFSADPSYGTNDIGNKAVSRWVNIKAYNLDGNEIESEIGSKKSYFFSVNQLKVFSQYSSSNNNYITIHQYMEETNDETGRTKQVIREGLIDGQGKVLITPEYKSVEQLHEDFFLVKKSRRFQIINVKDQTEIPMDFQEIVKFGGHSKFSNDFVFFDNNIIVKSRGKYGIYNLASQKWKIPNEYKKMRVVIGNLPMDDNSKKTFPVLFTNMFRAKLDNKWGLIDDEQKVLIPFNYYNVKGKLYNSYSRVFEILNDEKNINYYDVDSQEEYFESFYKEVSFNPVNKNIAILKKGKYCGVFDMESKQFLVNFEEKYINSRALNRFRFYVFQKANLNTTSAFDRHFETLFSIEEKKVLLKDRQAFGYVHRNNSLLTVTDFDRKMSVIDIKGEVVIPPTAMSGMFEYYDEKIVVRSSHDTKKVYNCFTKDGKELNVKDCKR